MKNAPEEEKREKFVNWVGNEILPHEADLRAWLARTFNPNDIEDIIQEAYCNIAELEDVGHIRNGRAYLFTTARSIVLMQLRRARIVSITAVAEIGELDFLADEPSPETVAAGRMELARIMHIIRGLPERCRKIFELRKIEGLSQREVAAHLRIPEHTVENDVRKGLKLVLKALEQDQWRGTAGSAQYRNHIIGSKHGSQARNSLGD